MPNSLKAKLSKLRYKGQITNEEYQELIAKLDGHDEKIRADERAKGFEEIDGFCFDYNKTAKCFGECSKCPLGIFAERMKGEQK